MRGPDRRRRRCAQPQPSLSSRTLDCRSWRWMRLRLMGRRLTSTRLRFLGGGLGLGVSAAPVLRRRPGPLSGEELAVLPIHLVGIC